MGLKIGDTYEGLFYNLVIDGLRDLLIAEYKNATIYVSPKITHANSFQIRLWGTEATLEKEHASAWQKQYNVGICMYLIEKNPSELFYKQLYNDSERIFQLIHNNKTYTKAIGSTNFTWIDGKIDTIRYNEYEEGEEDIEGLSLAKFDFSCLAERTS